MRSIVSNRVLDRDAAVSVGEKVFGFTSSDVSAIEITHTALGITRVVGNEVKDGDDGDEVTLSIDSPFGSLGAASIELNQLDDATIKSAVETLEALARQMGSPPPVPQSEVARIGSREYPKVNLFHESTEWAMVEGRHAALPVLIEPIINSGLNASAFVGVMARSKLIMRKEGLTAYEQETDAELTVTATNAEVQGSGWAGASSRDWNNLDPAMIAGRVIELTKRSANPVAFEPGRYTAILSPEAVAQLVRLMPYSLDAYWTAIGGMPFSKGRNGNKIGQKVMDERINLSSDPTDPDGGYMPFFTGAGSPIAGLPFHAENWIEHGVLKNLQYNPGYASIKGKQYNSTGDSLRLGSAVNTTLAHTTDLEDMISSCERGIYVNQFSGVELIDRRVGMMSGVTRNGCFLIRNGKIDRAIKNFRFMESPFLFLNNVEAIGRSIRCSLGYVPPKGRTRYSWPVPPIIVPPLRIKDFNFVALADAV